MQRRAVADRVRDAVAGSNAGSRVTGPARHRALREAFGTFLTGVTVTTALRPDGTPVGFTANSFTSVSLDPPLLLVCIADTSRNRDAFTQARGFAVNILSETQKDVSNTFARPAEDRFAAVAWRPGPHGAPILDGVSAWFDCSMHKTVEAGDHAILIGEVEAFATTPVPGLGYARGAYVTSAQEALALSHGERRNVVSALIEREGRILLNDDGAGGLTLPQAVIGEDGAGAALSRLIAEAGVDAAPGFVYSIFDDVARGLHHISFLCKGARGQPARGAFTPLRKRALTGVTDPAIRTMLLRLAGESRVGHYGLYFGDQDSGDVRRYSPQG